MRTSLEMDFLEILAKRVYLLRYDCVVGMLATILHDNERSQGDSSTVNVYYLDRYTILDNDKLLLSVEYFHAVEMPIEPHWCPNA